MKEFCTRERSTFEYSTYLRDTDGSPVLLSAIATLKLTLYNWRDGAIINGRDHQDAKNANGVTIHPTSGLLTFRGGPDDSPIVDPSDQVSSERHIALWEWTYGIGGLDGGNHEVAFIVENVALVA